MLRKNAYRLGDSTVIEPLINNWAVMIRELIDSLIWNASLSRSVRSAKPSVWAP